MFELAIHKPPSKYGRQQRSIYQHIEVWAKWTLFYLRYFQMYFYFSNITLGILIIISLKFVPNGYNFTAFVSEGPVDNKLASIGS